VVILTVLILALAGLNLLFVPGLLEGLVKNANDQVKNTYAGDVVVESATDNPEITDSQTLIQQIQAINGVTAVTARNTLGAMISFENERNNCVISGILPDTENNVFTTGKSMIEGTFLEANDLGQIVLGIEIAGADRTDIELYSRSLKRVHAGDKVTVSYGNGVNKVYTVKGIFFTDFIQTDAQAFVSEKEFETVQPAIVNQAASIRLKTKNEAVIKPVTEQIKQLRSGIRVLTWEDYAGIVRSMTESFRVINTILNVVNILIAGITVFIVTYIDVTNRRRQIGIQRAIGITRSSIMMSYLLRAVFYAIIGGVSAGLIFSYVIVPIEAQYPFHFPLGNVFLQTGWANMTRSGIILMAAAVAASFVPVWMSLKIKILDAIWG
jgi:putative ABC transport system permease protein